MLRRKLDLPCFLSSQERYDPPANLLHDDGNRGQYVEDYFRLTDETKQYLGKLFSDTLRPNPERGVSGLMGFVLLNAGVVLMAPLDNKRVYLLDEDRQATELPVLPAENPKRYNGTERPYDLMPKTWSLSRYMEWNMHVPVDLAMRYGFAVMKARANNPELIFSLVDKQGRSGKIGFDLPCDITLGQPPELI